MRPLEDLPVDTYQDLVNEAASYQISNDNLTFGQSLSKCLMKAKPELYRKILWSKYDPYHIDDKKLSSCLQYIQDHWED